jgi:hypothetical protein
MHWVYYDMKYVYRSLDFLSIANTIMLWNLMENNEIILSIDLLIFSSLIQRNIFFVSLKIYS